MKISKADYDELVRLQEQGCTVIIKEIHWIVWGESEEFYSTTHFNPDLIPNRSKKLNIAAAIAEYERAQEGKENV